MTEKLVATSPKINKMESKSIKAKNNIIKNIKKESPGNKAKQDEFVLILPNIRSAHNVGAMFRTADGAGVDKIYLTGYTARPPHPGLDKVALGAEKWLPHEYYKTPQKIVRELKRQGYEIVALEQTKNSVNIYKWKPKKPLALIVGNEKTGVSKSILNLCDAVVHLPMRGFKNSLNVSVAAGVALYRVVEMTPEK